MQRIICAGLIAADLVFELDDLPAKGTKSRANASRLITGGGALNAASAIASLGGNVTLCGAIGDDEFGHFLRQKMKDRGIDDQFVTATTGTPTSRSANVITPDGDRTIINHRDAKLVPNAIGLPSDFPFDAALVDTRFPQAALQIVTAAKRAGKPCVIDAEAPVADAQSALEMASHIVFSEQGLKDYFGSASPDALSQVASRLGIWCAVTRGASSVLCHDGTQLREIQTIPTQALNTLGAGDVWHGAFTLALAQLKPEQEAAHWANAAAAIKVSQPIQSEELPTATEVAALMKKQDAVMCGRLRLRKV